ncbi:hypothetical protein BJ973_002933 [Actinoplanes tereljensis]|uniref:Uncharacterized protein n=1 Tax=Paractinoplanes tereljensis TaxID=571912 RepID=A0A919TVS4_9ACTN|nr:DUF6518 family protein [Actinoplanes tereljensis]GIF22610.1 hypothetical protein Ate02nite_53400 [Actinoplanes tereljensis]
MPTVTLRRAVSLLGAALVFGALAALIKGHHYGLRDTIGNLSTPWLLVAFAAGLHTRSLPRGAVAGLAATGAALLGFYLVVAVITDDQLPLGEHLVHVLRVNLRWLLSGLVSGPVLGAFGAWVRRRASNVPVAATLVTGALLFLEPVVIVAARVVPGWRHVIHWTLSPGPYLVEAVVGAMLLALAVIVPTVSGDRAPPRSR